VFDEMVDMGVEPNHSTYNAMVGGYLKMGDLNAAVKLQTRMNQMGMKLPGKLWCMLRTLAEAMLDGVVDDTADDARWLRVAKYASPRKTGIRFRS
jgi:pentatricopeptide repeat protein